jgi:hypothetical protein
MIKPIILATFVAVTALPVAAEPSYNHDFYVQLSTAGLEREAFIYALGWAGDADPDAETVVAYALLDGIGVEANPLAAITIACKSVQIDDFERRKIFVTANMRLAGTKDVPARCSPVGH